ncbi:MAG: ATP cone domain-containing protein, partial [Verrucomicrobiota bacterium]
MRCPKCGGQDDKVIDSRSSKEGATIRRRRECLACAQRFTTYEQIEHDPLMVVKRDGRREMFSKEKLLSSLQRACQKRPVSEDDLATALERIQ